MSVINANKHVVTLGNIQPSNESVKLNKTDKVEKKEVGNSLLLSDTFKTESKEARTPLQKHVAFFDQDNDGIVHVSETFKGLRDLGLSKSLSAFGAVFINGGLGSKTGEKFSNFTVNISKIAQAKHDSDTDVFDEKGNFSSTKFEELFDKYDLDKDGALSKEEFLNFRNRNKETTSGGIASKGEFDLLIKVAGTDAKVDNKATKTISKERMLEFYNGNLFYKLAGKEVPSEK